MLSSAMWLSLAVALLASDLDAPVRAPRPSAERDLRPVLSAKRLMIALPPSEDVPSGTDLKLSPITGSDGPAVRIESPHFVIEAREILLKERVNAIDGRVSLIRANSARCFDVITFDVEDTASLSLDLFDEIGK